MSNKIHKILDAESDSKCIESFEPGTGVAIESITVGTQIYYLYKDEDDATMLQWYWGIHNKRFLSVHCFPFL